MPVRFLIEKVPAQCEASLQPTHSFCPHKKFPSSIPSEEQQRLTKAITDAVVNEVLPAYKAFGALHRRGPTRPTDAASLKHCLAVGRQGSLLNDILSRTTVSSLSPDEIHAIGLKEIDRIQADMWRSRAKRASRICHPSAERSRPPEVQTHLRRAGRRRLPRYVAQMQPKLPDLFVVIPGSPVTVEAMPDFQAASATHYQTGTPTASAPARIVVGRVEFRATLAHR